MCTGRTESGWPSRASAASPASPVSTPTSRTWSSTSWAVSMVWRWTASPGCSTGRTPSAGASRRWGWPLDRGRCWSPTDSTVRAPSRSTTTPGMHFSTGPIYKISYDLSYDYRKCIVRSTYDSDLKRAEIFFQEYRKLVYEHYLWRYYTYFSSYYTYW